MKLIQNSREIEKELIRKLCDKNIRLERYINYIRKNFTDDLSLLLVKFFPANHIAKVLAEVKGLEYWNDEFITKFIRKYPNVKLLVGDGVVVLNGENLIVLTHLVDEARKKAAVEKLLRKRVEGYQEVVISYSAFEALLHASKADDIDTAERKIKEMLSLGSETRAVKIFEYIIKQAIYHGASDVHLEFFGSGSVIRFRIAGTLETFANITSIIHYTLINYLKNQIGAEGRKDTRKDGSLQIEGVDIRVNIMPSAPYVLMEEATNERAVLRLLRKAASLSHGINSITDVEVEKQLLEAAIRSSYGMIITSGPTSSGKTTTLYVLLSSIDAMSKKIITAEDPIEFLNPYLWQQHQVSEVLGWEEIIKGMLREDPDVCLVGEVRDKASAKMLVRLANTGHLTFTTIHANNSFEIIRRLKDLEIEDSDIKEFGVLFMAQRLLRVSCPHCQFKRKLDPVEAKILMVEEGQEVIDNEGCPRCRYTGTVRERKLVIEFLPLFFDDVKQLIEEGADYVSIFRYLKERYGIKRLAEKALELNKQGLVSITEIMEKVR
ncbi:GspE/PulE family protein [Persephonella sp.]